MGGNNKNQGIHLPSFSLVIPCHNEADNILKLLEEIQEHLTGLSYEILVIDDCSTDNTLDVLKTALRTIKNLRVIHHQKNSGQSKALHTGVQMARAQVIVTMDGDGQNNPADIPMLLEEYKKARGRPFLLVTGWRKQRRDTWKKRISSTIANGIRKRVLKDYTPDTGCGLKVFKKDDFLTLPFFDHMHRFLPALFLAMGGEVISREVSHRERRGGKSHYGTWDRLWVGIVDLFGVLWLKKRLKSTHILELEGHED